MSKVTFKVSLSPAEALEMIRAHHSSIGTELIHEEMYDLGDGKTIGTLVFQKYYFRAGNKAALVVISDNFKGFTEVRSVATGSSQSVLFNFDWGASDDFADSTRQVLKDYLVEE